MRACWRAGYRAACPPLPFTSLTRVQQSGSQGRAPRRAGAMHTSWGWCPPPSLSDREGWLQVQVSKPEVSRRLRPAAESPAPRGGSAFLIWRCWRGSVSTPLQQLSLEGKHWAAQHASLDRPPALLLVFSSGKWVQGREFSRSVCLLTRQNIQSHVKRASHGKCPGLAWAALCSQRVWDVLTLSPEFLDRSSE